MNTVDARRANAILLHVIKIRDVDVVRMGFFVRYLRRISGRKVSSFAERCFWTCHSIGDPRRFSETVPSDTGVHYLCQGAY